MVKRPQPRRWWQRTPWWQIVATSIVGATLVTVFQPATSAAWQFTFVDADHFNAADRRSLAEHGVGPELTKLGYKPLGKFEDRTSVLWFDCPDPKDDDGCLVSVMAGRNRIFATTFDRNWRGTITGVELTAVSWVDDRQWNDTYSKMLTSLQICRTAPGATVAELLAGKTPDVKYCK